MFSNRLRLGTVTTYGNYSKHYLTSTLSENASRGSTLDTRVVVVLNIDFLSNWVEYWEAAEEITGRSSGWLFMQHFEEYFIYTQ